jgi:type IV pilus assembly protein PilN
MIKINLLPVRATKKKETAKQQVSIYVICLLGTLAVCAALYVQAFAKVKVSEGEIRRAEEEKAALKLKIGEIDRIKLLEAEVKKKLDVLEQLRRGKTGPAKRFATLSEVTPERLWLTKYAEQGDKISISGMAITEEIVADFMRKLEASPDFRNVNLTVTEQADLKGLKVKRFDLTCELEQPKKDEPAKR